MNLSEYNHTVSSIEELIHSNEVVNCEMGCEILKGLEWPNGMKLDIIEPICSFYLDMSKNLTAIGNEAALLKAQNLLNKVAHLNSAVAFINY